MKDKALKKVKDSLPKKFNSVCSGCGKPFNCGVVAGQPDCWCFKELAGKTIQNYDVSSCLCKDCLTK